jgi:hypothetical protein
MQDGRRSSLTQQADYRGENRRQAREEFIDAAQAAGVANRPQAQGEHQRPTRAGNENGQASALCQPHTDSLPVFT